LEVLIENDAPVSNTIGRVGTELETEVVVGTEAKTADEESTVAEEATVAVGSAEAKGSTVVPAPIRETIR